MNQMEVRDLNLPADLEAIIELPEAPPPSVACRATSTGVPTPRPRREFVKHVTNLAREHGFAPRAKLPGRLLRAFPRKVSRRAAAMVVVASVATYLTEHFLSARRVTNSVGTQSAGRPDYQAPTVWDGHAEAVRQEMLRLDHQFRDMENPTTQHALNGWVLELFSSKRREQKRRVATYLADTKRWQYVHLVLPALSPTVSDPDTRLVVAGQLLLIAATASPDQTGFTSATLDHVKRLAANEPDGHVAAKLSRLVQELAAAGL